MKHLSVIAFLFLIVFSSCKYVGGKRVRGNGTVKSETRTVGAFNGTEVGGNIDLFVTQDSVASVRIETDENLLPYVKTEISGNTLSVYSESGYDLRASKSINVYVTGPTFEHLEASGASNIVVNNQLTSGTEISLNANGASNIDANVNAPVIAADLSGASGIKLKGQTKNFNASASGASTLKCFELLSENADVELSGASSADVFASVDIKAEASGASSVRYKGSAKRSANTSGAGSVKKVD